MIGEVIDIYHDEFNAEFLGKARLVKLISRGLPIILPSKTEYEVPTQKQLVYRFDRYQVEFVDETIPNASSTYKVRVLHKIGPVANKEVDELDKLPKDSFLRVNGKEIY
jgi:hypothetical protein